MKQNRIHQKQYVEISKLGAATMTLIPAAVGINYVAKALAEGLKLPPFGWGSGNLSFQHVGWAGCRCHQWFLINNVIYGLTLSPISSTVCDYQRRNWDCCRSFARQWVVLVSATSICFAIIIAFHRLQGFNATNVIFLGGQTGRAWGDLHILFAVMVANHAPVWLASFTDEFVLIFQDKVCVAYSGILHLSSAAEADGALLQR